MLCILYRLDIYHCDVSMRDIGFPNTETEPAVDQVQFLMVVDKEWTSHCRQMVCYGMLACSNISEGTLLLSSITESQIMLRSISSIYLDRTYAVPSTSLLSIWYAIFSIIGMQPLFYCDSLVIVHSYVPFHT